MSRSLKPILHHALGLRFGKVCEQKREKNARKTREKRNRLAFLPNVQCNIEKIFHVGLAFLIFLTFFTPFHSSFGYQHVGIQNVNKLV